MLLRLLIVLAITPLIFCDVEDPNVMRVELKRFKSARLQYMKYPELSVFGTTYHQLLKKKKKYTALNDTISLFRYLDNEFYGDIIIGHRAQKFKVSFDTAWQHTWVMSFQCNTPGCAFHNKYNHKKSSEYKPDNRPFSIDSDGLKLKGFYSFDNISFAHSNVTQSFVEMTNVPTSFALNKADGVMGLAPKTSDYTPFFYNWLSQNSTRKPIFCIYLNRHLDTPKGGSIILGALDQKHIHVFPNKTKEPIKYLPAKRGVPHWQFPIDEMFLDAHSPNFNLKFCSKGCQGVSDTSSTDIIGPKQDIDQILTSLEAKVDYNRTTVDCDTIAKLPVIGFVLGGQKFNMTGKDYIRKESHGALTYCVVTFQESVDAQNTDLWVLGGAFLSKFYSVYNTQDMTVGFVRAA